MSIIIDGTGTISGVSATGLTTAQLVNATNITSGTLPTARLPAGSVLKVQQFTDSGSSTTSGTLVNLNGSSFGYTPVSTNSTLYITCSFYAYLNPAAGYAAGSCYGYYNMGEYNGSAYVAFAYVGYLWNYQFATTYAQSIGIQSNLMYSRSNSSLTTRSFDLMGAVSNSNVPFYANSIVMQIIEVAN